MEYVVFCTVPDMPTAEKMAMELVKNKAAACCNLIPNLQSIYSWQGRIEQDQEVLMLLKTTKERYSLLESEILRLHPYQVPEILACPVEQGGQRYRQWMHEVLSR